MSILTFVENCIKHGSADDDLEISITAMPVQKADGTYLSVTIENDGGPFEQSILDHLNSQDSSEVKYQSMQVGISNVPTDFGWYTANVLPWYSAMMTAVP